MKSRLLVLALGCLFALLCAELFLRFVGLLEGLHPTAASTSSAMIDPNRPQLDVDDRLVLFIGNSYTAGVFVEPNERFSDRLRERLGTPWRVKNISRVDMNTRETLSVIKNMGPPYPKVVFIMAGEPNAWNNSGFAEYLNETGTEGTRTIYKTNSWLRRLRIVRFVQYYLYQTQDQTDKTVPTTAPDRDVKAAEFYAAIGKLIDRFPEPIATLVAQKNSLLQSISEQLMKRPELRNLRMARLILRANEVGEIRTHEAQIVEDLEVLTDRGHRFNYFSWVYLNGPLMKKISAQKIRKIRDFLNAEYDSNAGLRRLLALYQNTNYQGIRSALEDNSGESLRSEILNSQKTRIDDFGYKVSHFTNIGLAFARLNDFERACGALYYGLLTYPVRFSGEIFWGQIANYNHNCAGQRDQRLTQLLARLLDEKLISKSQLLRFQDDNELQQWRTYDLQKIIKFFQAKGSRVVVQTYLPFRTRNDERPENEALLAAANETDAIILDQFDRFLSLYPNISDRDFIYLQGPFKNTEDDHFSPEGHRLVSELIYKFMEQQGFLQQ